MRQTTLLLVIGLVLAGGAAALTLDARLEATPQDRTAETVDAGSQMPTAPSLDEADATVTVRDFEFEDEATGTPVTRIEAGETVRWTWTEGCHSVTEGIRGVGSSMFDSKETCAVFEDGDPQTTFEVTFDEPGVYTYHCQPHLQMEGLVVVQA